MPVCPEGMRSGCGYRPGIAGLSNAAVYIGRLELYDRLSGKVARGGRIAIGSVALAPRPWALQTALTGVIGTRPGVTAPRFSFGGNIYGPRCGEEAVLRSRRRSPHPRLRPTHPQCPRETQGPNWPPQPPPTAATQGAAAYGSWRNVPLAGQPHQNAASRRANAGRSGRTLREGHDLWQNQAVKVDGSRVEVTVGERNAAVIRLQ